MLFEFTETFDFLLFFTTISTNKFPPQNSYIYSKFIYCVKHSSCHKGMELKHVLYCCQSLPSYCFFSVAIAK